MTNQPQAQYKSHPKSVPYKKRIQRPEIPQPTDPTIRHIPLSRDQFCIVSAHRYDWAMQWNWSASPIDGNRGYYAVRYKRTWIDGKWKKNFIYLHKEILGIPQGDPHMGDHKNRCYLDNRDENLRFADGRQNRRNVGISTRNKSGFKGISWYPKYSKWLVRIRTDEGPLHLGYVEDKEEAARTYDRAAIKHHGEFAVLNFPRENYL